MNEATYKQAIRQVLKDNTASVINLRNKLHISDEEAIECINRMEQEKMIGPLRSPFPRQIRIKNMPKQYR